jgi:GAF domain-containing protein
VHHFHHGRAIEAYPAPYQIGESLSSETDLNKIFDMILEEGIEFTRADAATIYKLSDDGRNWNLKLFTTPRST